jgi:UDP-glucuronate 4-epimerase
MNILITGAAGFIGFHVSSLLLKKIFNDYGIDNLDNYYDLNLKLARLKILKKKKTLHFVVENLKIENFDDKDTIENIKIKNCKSKFKSKKFGNFKNFITPNHKKLKENI